MNALSALDLHYLVKELQLLVGAKVQKIYQPRKKEFIFQFHIPSIGSKFLRVTLPDFIFMTDFKEEQDAPLEYCKFLRKYLSNSRLTKITQKDFERILELTFNTKDGDLILIMELFSKGNLILCQADYLIKSPLEIQRWATRTIKGRVKYEFPKLKTNVLNLKETDFIELVKKTKKDKLVTFLAIDLSLGGKYSEELCSKLNKDSKPGDLKESEIKNLFKELTKLLNKKTQLNKLLDETITKTLMTRKVQVKQTAQDKKSSKLQRIIDNQTKTIEKFKKQIIENNKKADLIYSNYKLIEEIINELNKAKEKYSWKEIQDKLKGHKVIKEVNSKDKTILIEV